MKTEKPAQVIELYTHQKRYVEAQKKDGFVRVSVWVRPESRRKLINFAKEMRAAFIDAAAVGSFYE